jgi:hypothetical protein
MNRRAFLAILLAATSCMAAGCGSGYPPTAPVAGSVSVKGEPLKLGRICFYPTAGRPAMADIGPDGAFRLTTFQPDDGATIGKHRVTVEAIEIIGAPKTMAEEFTQAGKRAPPPQVVWHAAERFSRVETTDLVAEVKPGNNQIDFNLPTR